MPLYNKDKQGIKLTPSGESGVTYDTQTPMRSSYSALGDFQNVWHYKPIYNIIKPTVNSVDLFTLRQGYFTISDNREFNMLHMYLSVISPSTRGTTSGAAFVEYKYFTNVTSFNSGTGTGETVDATMLLTIENNNGNIGIYPTIGNQGVSYNINGTLGTTTFTVHGEPSAFIRGIYSYIWVVMKE